MIVSCCVATWVVVKIMVPFWIPSIIRHLIFRAFEKGPAGRELWTRAPHRDRVDWAQKGATQKKRDHNFDNHPHVVTQNLIL